MLRSVLLTAENHHENREYLFRLGESGHIAETDAGHAGQREIKCRDVSHRVGRTTVPEDLARCVAHDVMVADVTAERLQPAVEDTAVRFKVADGEPNAGEPMSNEDEHDK